MGPEDIRKSMLSEILNNFSTDELKRFLSKDALEFALQFTEEESVDDNDSVYSKSDIIKIIVNTSKADFVYDERLRTKLIERLSKQQLLDLFPEFSNNENGIHHIHYDAVISWTNSTPRNFAKKLGLADLFDARIEQETTNKLESISRVEPNFALYPYQFEISKQTFLSFRDGIKRALIHLPTGAGKTRTAMNIACEHLRASKKNVVLWLADREELCTQAYIEFKKAWGSLGNYSTSLYGFYSGSAESLGGIDSGFVVAGLQKFLTLRENNSPQLKLLYKELAESVTMVIFDEAHKSVAPRYKDVIEDFVTTDGFDALLIGLTATPGRSYSEFGLTEEDALLANFFFNNKITMRVPGYLSPIDYLVEQGYLANANFKSLNYANSAITAFELKDSNTNQTMKALAENRDRNKVILDVIKGECLKGAKIIVFACSVSHSINLATALAYHGINAASVDSSNDSLESRRAKINRYKNGDLQVLVNFNVLTAGFDAPKTNVTVIAKPMNSLVQYLQMAGRAMRGPKSGGNEECYIYTVMDDIPEFQSVTKAFNYWNEMWATKEEV